MSTACNTHTQKKPKPKNEQTKNKTTKPPKGVWDEILRTCLVAVSHQRPFMCLEDKLGRVYYVEFATLGEDLKLLFIYRSYL